MSAGACGAQLISDQKFTTPGLFCPVFADFANCRDFSSRLRNGYAAVAHESRDCAMAIRHSLGEATEG